MPQFARQGLPTANRFVPDCLSDMQFVPQWFAVHTSSRHEKRVSLHFSVRDIEHYLPLYRTQSKWRDGSRITLELPLFPGYMFVHVKRSERLRVLEAPGVLAIVSGAGRALVPVPDAEIDAMRLGFHLRHVEPHPFLKVGQLARIRSGALAGMEGIVVRKKNNFHVILTMNLIMQSVAVEVDGAELEPLNSPLGSRAL
jgi:transcription antitermination factor NusG